MRRTMLLVLLAALAAAPYAVGGEPGESGPPEVIYVPRDQLDERTARTISATSGPS